MARSGLENADGRNIFIRLPTRDNGTDIIHVIVGIPGEWEPTEEELQHVTEMFVTALSSNQSVIATRVGIKAKVLHIKAT
jgi:hypothetical protein